jgi:rSAM/selenodomain-associated transferase 1
VIEAEFSVTRSDVFALANHRSFLLIGEMNAGSTPPETRARTLGLFAKRPWPGQVKTRLAAVSSPEWAAAVATAFQNDVLDRLSLVGGRRVLAFTPPDAAPYFAGLAAGRYLLTAQAEGDLGRRMAAFFTEQLQITPEGVVLVGTDSPTLPLSFIEQAFNELEDADVVLGPAADGGYYLVGCARRLPPIFDSIVWSSSRVLEETVARLAGTRDRLALLPPWYDVDTIDDWWMLRGHVAAQRRAGLDPGVPRVEHLMARRSQEGEPLPPSKSLFKEEN